MRCTRPVENTGCKNSAKKSPSAHHRTTLSAISSQVRHVSTIGKKLVKQQYLLHVSSQYGERRPLTAEIGWGVLGTPANFKGFASWLRYCTDVAQRRSTTLCTIFGRLLGWYIIYKLTFWGGSCPLTAFCQVQNSLCVQVLRYSILAALLHGNRAVGVSQTLRRGTFTRQAGHPAVELSCFISYYLRR